MKALSRPGLLLVALVSTGAAAQPNLPYIVRLPADDFVWPWGEPRRNDDRERPEFTIEGHEAQFACTLTGSFRPASRMSDFAELREFEHTLEGSINFIQDAVPVLNELYRVRELDWAILDCIIPEAEESEEKTQERLDKALERAERARERRREAADADE